MKSPNLNYKNQPPSVVSPPSSVFESICPEKANVKVNFQFGLKSLFTSTFKLPQNFVIQNHFTFFKEYEFAKIFSRVCNLEHVANKAIAETVDWQI